MFELVGLALSAVQTALSTIQTLQATIQALPQLKEMFSHGNYLSDLESLEDIVSAVEALLQDAQSKDEQQLSSLDRVSIEKLKNAVYEADDLLDEFATLVKLEAHQLDMEGNNKKLFRRVRKSFSRFFKKDKLAKSMSQEVKKIRDKFGRIKDDANLLEFLKLDHRQPIRKREETYSYVNEKTKIVGRDVDKESIIKMLLDPSIRGDYLVLAIVGMGGLGKTALAQLVYNDQGIEKEFGKRRFWVCVSDQDQNQFDIKAIVARIYEVATCVDRDMGGLTLQSLVQKLRDILDENKYFLVLDDVWTEDRDKCKELLGILMGSSQMAKKGSRILVTTRSKSTATAMGCKDPYELQGLSKEDSWRLFKITSGIDENRRDLVEMGEDIVEKCANVPLAINVIGSFLFCKKENVWRFIQQKGVRATQEDGVAIMPILKFSYHHLSPSSLKSCFTYCAVFPKNYVFGKESLISLWMAYDCVKDEATGERYFDILTQRCFFQDVKKDDLERVSFKIHDLMLDLAQEVAGKEISTAYSDTKSIDNKIYHLYDLTPDIRTEGFMTKAKIRTYIATDSNRHRARQFPISALLTNWRSVRVLHLGRLGITNLPNAIGELLHLRHLDLSQNRQLKTLPESLTRLVNLQFLSLDKCNLEDLPQDLNKLVSLKTLKVDHNELRYMPSGMDKMTSLTRLSTFVVGQRNSGVKHDVGQLKDLLSLTKLRGHLCIQISKEYRHAKENGDEGGYLRNREHLTSVRIEWLKYCEESEDEAERVHHDEELLKDLKPHHNLKWLEISGCRGVRFPVWGTEDNLRTHLPKLAHIGLVGCPGIKELPGLGNLPDLKWLELKHLKNLEYIEEHGRSGTSSSSSGCGGVESSVLFPSLEQVKLVTLPKLKGWWRESSGSMYASGSDSEMLSNQSGVHTSGRYQLLPSFPRLIQVEAIQCPNMRRPIPLCPPGKYLTLEDLYGGFEIKIEKDEEEEEKEKREGSSNDSGNWNSRGANAPRIREITTNHVRKLKSLPMVALQWLTKIKILDGDEVECLSEAEDVFRRCSSSLRSLKIQACFQLRSVTGGLKYLTALESLCFKYLPELRLDEKEGQETEEEEHINAYELPWKCFAHSLRSLHLDSIRKVEELPKGMSCLTALQTLHIIHLPLRILPEWIGCLSSLQSLVVDCSLQDMKSLPEGLRNLTCLNTLRLSLKKYAIFKERCQRPDGEDWPKIQHIPQVYIARMGSLLALSMAYESASETESQSE